MKNKQIKLCILLFLGIGLTGLKAQTALPATGGNATSSGGSASYSVGQMVYTTNTGTNGSVAQGVQQPFEISVVVGIKETSDIALSVSAYPNPSSDYLTLSIGDSEISDTWYELYDMNGKLLQNEIITDNHTSIAVRNLVPATYFVKIRKGNQEVKTFKIIKK